MSGRAASLKYHSCPRHLTWSHTQSHYPDTGLTSYISTPCVWVPSEEQLVPFLTNLVCRPGSNHWPPIPQSGHSTNQATWAVKHLFGFMDTATTIIITVLSRWWPTKALTRPGVCSFVFHMSMTKPTKSDWADAQDNLSLRWAHMPFCWFVTMRLNVYTGMFYIPNSCIFSHKSLYNIF